MKDIDRRVAERVMGWKLCSCMKGFTHQCDGYHDYLWHPSIDIAQVFQVVERMVELGWDFRVAMMQGAQVYAEFGHYPDTNDAYYFRADTPALAIVKAALAAVGEIP